jgi:hypothetical protein
MYDEAVLQARVMDEGRNDENVLREGVRRRVDEEEAVF